MEEMLNGFQSDLSSISTEIQSLQEQSISMNVKLKNRQVCCVITFIPTEYFRDKKAATSIKHS